MERYKIVISVYGKVQKVGFRNFVKREAISHGLYGWVKNLDTGIVEIYVEGEKINLDRFLKQIQIGNDRSEVAYINLKWTKQNEFSYSEFNILYS